MSNLKSLTTPFGHQRWSQTDILHLTIAYQCGASLSIMSRIVRRSTSAVNKQLTRYGLRTRFGVQDHKSYGNHKKSATYEQVMAAIAHFYNITAYQEQELSDDLHKKVESEFMIPVFNALCPPKFNDDVVIKIREMVHYGRQAGLNICRLDHPHFNALGYDYKLNEKPVTESQLLVHINQHRLDQGLPIFTVTGVTCE